MRAVIPPDGGPYPYAGTGYANPDAVTQIANGLSTTTFSYDNNGNLAQKTGGLNNQVQHLSGRVLRWEPTTSI